MRRLVLGVSLFAVAIAATSSAAVARPSAPSSATVIAKMVDAYGGRTVLESIKNKVEVISLQSPQQNATTTITRVSPDKYLQVVELPGLHQVITTGYDGTTAWVDDTYGNVKQLTGDQLGFVRCAAPDQSAAFLHPDTATVFALQPDQTLDGKEYVVLLVSRQGCPNSTLYVDPKTYLLSREADAAQTIDFSNYVSGPLGEKYAKTLSITSGMGSFLGNVTSVKDNASIDDAIFVMPQKPSPSPAAGASPVAPTPAASATP